MERVVNSSPRLFYPRKGPGIHCIGGCVDLLRPDWTGAENLAATGNSIPGRSTHPASCTMGTGSFPGVKCGRGVLLTTHHLPVLRSWKSRAILLPPSGPHRACNGIPLHYIYIYIYIYVCIYKLRFWRHPCNKTGEACKLMWKYLWIAVLNVWEEGICGIF